jgi:hypothetical protein
MTTDSELQTLQEKVKRLTHDRDVAMKMAARSDEQVKALKTEVENYRRLWQHAEAHKIYDPLSLVDYDPYQYEVPVIINSGKKKRTIHDWIWLGVWLAAAGGTVYVIGWILPGAFS